MEKTIFILGAGALREGAIFSIERVIFGPWPTSIWHVPSGGRQIEGTRDGERQTVEEVAWPGSNRYSTGSGDCFLHHLPVSLRQS